MTKETKQQTTVDWIEQEMLKGNLSMKEILEQAKEMQKAQHDNTWGNALSAITVDKWESFDQFYNETYGDNK
jgi:hypothetical protein